MNTYVIESVICWLKQYIIFLEKKIYGLLIIYFNLSIG